MKRITKILVGTMLAALMTLSLTACGETFDPVAYMQGSLDSVYHNEQSQEFLDNLDDENSIESLKKDREDSINEMAENLAMLSGVTDPSDETLANVKKMLSDVYAATKYEVGEATEDEDGGYAVAVTVYPLLSFASVATDEDGIYTDALTEALTADMSEDEMYETALSVLCNLIEEQLKDPQYGEAIETTLKISDEGDYYIVDEDEFADLENLLLNIDA